MSNVLIYLKHLYDFSVAWVKDDANVLQVGCWHTGTEMSDLFNH